MKSFLFFCGEILHIRRLAKIVSFTILSSVFLSFIIKCFALLLHNILCILNIHLRVCNYQYGVLNKILYCSVSLPTMDWPVQD